MKCPEMFKIVQHNIRNPIVDKDDIIRGEYHILIETQGFCECYKEKCAAWDNKKNRCRKMKQK